MLYWWKSEGKTHKALRSSSALFSQAAPEQKSLSTWQRRRYRESYPDTATNQKQIQMETGNNAGRPSDLRSEELCYYEPKTMAWAEIKSVFTWVLMRSAI